MNKSPGAVEIVIAESSSQVPAEAKLQHWGSAALAASAKDGKEATCCLRVVSSAEMTELNSQFANKPKPTNVLSFPNTTEADPAWSDELADLIALDGGEAALSAIGDIAICTEVVAGEAQEQGKSLESHWAHMLVHGVLHLRGYDHTNDAMARIMESEEIRILATLGFPDPYTTAEKGDHKTS